MRQETNRKEYNMKIVESLFLYIQKYPDMRFHQALQNLGINKTVEVQNYDTTDQYIKDDFYEESKDTWEKMKGHD